MSNSPAPSGENGPESPNMQMDRVCRRFEAAMRDGQKPQIEEFLDAYPELDRLTLISKLITLELDLVHRAGETITVDLRAPRSVFDGYRRRFPEAIALLNRVQQDWELNVANPSRLECPPVGFDPEIETLNDLKPFPPRHIKQFQLQSILGRGGFGIVWRARDMRLQRDVAIKVPRADRLAVADRAMFLREARAAAKLRHPNIVAIHEVCEDDSEVFIVSELIDGVSLKEWLQTHKLTPAAAAQLITKLAQAVQHAHDKKIIHRDLKPANVLMDQQGEPHVGDFGLAKRDASEESISVSGQIIGTPAYMAPEQASGNHPAIDVRTDVYALGAIFYELLTGVRPFRGEVGVLLELVKNAPPEAPRKIKPDIPKDLEAICLKCLAKDPGKRYASAAALAEDLHLYMAGETLRGIPAALPNRMWKWFRRHRRFVTAIGLTFLVALTAAGSLAWQFRGTKPAAVETREVDIVTEPEGCEITVVALNPDTGDPDPGKIRQIKGRTPLTATLEPADYLIVAVLDETRFHEVYRHVPSHKESLPTMPRHLTWKKTPAGHIVLEKIKIPRADITHHMGLVERSTNLLEPQKHKSGPERRWYVPSFYVDPREISIQDIEDWGGKEFGAENWAIIKRTHRQPDWGPGPYAQMSYADAVLRLEKQGKRLPTTAELYSLTAKDWPPQKRKLESDTCILADHTPVTGLHSRPWEWTSTKPGAPFTGLTRISQENMTHFLIKTVGGADTHQANKESQNPVSFTGFLSMIETNNKNVGARGVRSAKPRRKPEDFTAPVDKLSVH